MAFITNATRKVVIDHVVATLGRAPTTKELADVTVLLNDGASLADVAGYLTTSDAYLSKYPIGQTASEVAADILDAAIVGGVLAADIRLAVIDLIAGGLTGGAYTIASATNAVVAYLSDPANNDNADLGDIAKAFQNRTAAAEEFTTTFTLEGATVTAADLAAAVEGVTSDAATLTAAKAAFAAGYTGIAAQTAAEEKAAADAAAAKAAEEKAAADAAAAKAAEEKAAADKAAADKAAADKAAADEAAAASAPKAFELTTGVNNFTGGLGDDSFDASLTAGGQQTLNTLDRLAGGEGSDTLNAFISASVTPTSISGIETINAGANAVATLGLANATGLETVNLAGSTGAFTLTGLSKAVAVAIADSAVAHTISYNDVTGAADSATVSLANLTGGNALTLAGVEALTINSIGTANNVALTATSAGYLTVTGSGNFTSSSLAGAGMSFVRSIDGSAATGDLTLTTGNQAGLGSTDLTVKGGSGDDALDVSGHTGSNINVDGGAGNDTVTIALGADDTVAGGDGVDTLRTTSAAGVGATVSGFESFTADAALTQDFDYLSGNEFATVTIDVAGANSVTFRDAPASVTTLNLNRSTLAANTGTVALDRSADTDADALTVKARGSDQTGLTLTHEESITIDSSTAATTVGTLTAPDATSLTITGDEDLTITNLASNTLLASIDASASTGAISVGATSNASLADMTITAGTGGMEVDGGAGDDTFTGNAGNDSVDGGEGADALTGAAGNDDLDGGAGNDTLLGGDGNDTLTIGAGDDSVDGGAGNDSIVLGTNLSANDVIDGGDGTDTASIELGAATTIPALTSVEVLSVDNSTGGTATVSFALASAVNKVNWLADSDDQNLVLSGFGGGTVISYEAGDDLTVDTTAGASLAVYSAVAGGAVTVADASSVTIVGAAANASFGVVTLDAVDTTSLTLTAGGTGTEDLTVTTIDGTDQLTSLTVTTNEADGDIVADDMADADSLTSLTIVAAAGDVTLAEIGGAAGVSGSAESLATVSVTATAGAQVSTAEIFADNVDGVTDNDMTVTLSASGEDSALVASSITLDSIANAPGTATISVSGDGASTITNAVTSQEITVTKSGEGAASFGDLDAGSTLTMTLAGAGDVTVTTSDAEGDTSITATDLTGDLDFTTTSTHNVTVTGGTGADDITVGNSAVGFLAVVDGGAGADTIVGGTSADSLIGGDGNDSITAGGGNDTIDAGAGNDRIVMGTTLNAYDNIDGGDGIDTVTATVQADYSGTLTGVEYLVLDEDVTGKEFATGSASKITVTGDAGETLTLVDVADGAEVEINDDNVVNTINAITGGSLTLDYKANNGNRAVSVTDAVNVTIINGSAAADTSGASLALDSTDTTGTLTVTGASVAGNTLGTGNVTGTDELTALVVTTSTSGATATVGTVADADGLTSVTLTASGANATIGQIGTNATANNAELLANVNVTSSGTGVIANLGAIFADSTVNSTTDLAMTLTANAGVGSQMDIGAITNTYGSLNATYVTNTTDGNVGQDDIDQGTITVVDADISVSGQGEIDFAGFTASGDVEVTVTESAIVTITDANVDGSGASLIVNAEASTGKLDVAAGNTSVATTLTGGSAGDSLVGGSVADTITGNAGADTLEGGSGNDTIDGGTGNDSIVGGSGNDSLDGGAGNDSITGSAGDDVINGGDGVDTLTLGGVGSDTVDGGAGNDSIVASTYLSTNDSIDGGEGTDSMTATIADTSITRPASIANVERLTVNYTAAGTLDLRNATGITRLTIEDGSANGAVTKMSSDIASIILAEPDATTYTTTLSYDTSTDSAHTVTVADSAGAVDIGNITVANNAGSFTLSSGGAAANSVDAVTADSATTVTVVATSKGLTQTGAFGADDATTINIDSSEGDVSVAVGSAMTSTANVAVNLTADGGADDGDYDITVAALDVNYLTTLTATAANSSDITVSSLIFKGTNSVGTNITTSMNLTGGLGSTIDITLTEETDGTAQTMDLITLSGLGTFNITAADSDINVTEIDASAAIGATVLDFGTGIDNAMTITVGNTVSGLTGHSVTTGSGADDITGGSGNDTVSSGDGADTIIAGGGADSIDAGDGVDDIDAGAGNDLIYFNTGDGGDADVVDGGAGTDTLLVTDDLNLSSIVLVGGNFGDSGIEQIVITAAKDGIFDGAALDGQTVAINETGPGTTELQVEVAAGADIDLSNLTFASITYGASTGNAFDDSADIIDINVAAAGIVTGTSIADTINGTDGSGETLNGGGGNDTIDGGTGDDSITGGAGADTIDAQAGVDTVAGGGGNDTISLGGTDGDADTVQIAFGGEGTDTINEFEVANDIIDFTGTSDVVDGAGDGSIDVDGWALIEASGGAVAAADGFTVFDNEGGAGGGTDITDLTAITVAAFVARTDDLDGAAVGAQAFTLANADDVIYVAASDGTDTGIFRIQGDGVDTTIEADEVTLIGIIDGVADAGTLTNANFADFT
jgi:Ca2+-binding RTX toxin-like protein